MIEVLGLAFAGMLMATYAMAYFNLTLLELIGALAYFAVAVLIISHLFSLPSRPTQAADDDPFADLDAKHGLFNRGGR